MEGINHSDEVVIIDEREMAEFISQELLQNHSVIVTAEDIELVLNYEYEFMKLKGVLVDSE